MCPPTDSPPLSFSPLYRQVVGLLMRSLETGEWRPGVALPSEMELAQRFGVSQSEISHILSGKRWSYT